MSSCWSGDRVLGLFIPKEYVEGFLESYLEQNKKLFEGMEHADAITTLVDEEFTYDSAIWASDIGKENPRQFYARIYTDDQYDGCDVRFFSDSVGYVNAKDDFMFVEADKSLTTESIIKNGFYNSVEEIADEFREMLGKYLPEDFDYDGYIGELTFACWS